MYRTASISSHPFLLILISRGVHASHNLLHAFISPVALRKKKKKIYRGGTPRRSSAEQALQRVSTIALLYSQSTSTLFSQCHCKVSCPILYLVVSICCIALRQARCTWKRGKGILLQRAMHDRESHEAQSHMCGGVPQIAERMRLKFRLTHVR